MSHVIICGGQPWALENFRGDLIRKLVESGHRVTAMSDPATDEQSGRIRALGAGFRTFPVQRAGLNPLRDLQTFMALRRAFADLEPDVVLACTIKPVIWAGLALATLSGPDFFALIEGVGFSFQPKGLLRKVLTSLVALLCRLSLRHADAVIFLNQDNKKLFIDLRIVSPRVCRTIPGIGVPLDRFVPVTLPSGPIRFLLVARLLAEKGLREYAAAARIVKRVHPNVIVQLLGSQDSSPDAIPLSEVQAWQAESLIEYLGETTDVRPFIAECHVCVLPSYHEGMPRTIMEAMAMARPILTTNVPGCRETVVPGLNGLMVPMADADALAEAMIWYVEHRELLASMGNASRRMAEERFDVHKINAQIMDIMSVTRR